MTSSPKHNASNDRTEFLDVRKVAKLLTVSPTTVYELFTTGDLPGRKVGKKWMTTKEVLGDWFNNSVTGHHTSTNNAESIPPPPRPSVKRKLGHKTPQND